MLLCIEPVLYTNVVSYLCLYTYVVFTLLVSERSKRRSRTVAASATPRWNQTFIYSPVKQNELFYRQIELSVWHHERRARCDVAVRTPSRCASASASSSASAASVLAFAFAFLFLCLFPFAQYIGLSPTSESPGNRN